MPKIADKQERRDQVVEAAYRIIIRLGLEGTTMRAVASEAGCSIGLINHWFDSRNDLVEATFDWAITRELARASLQLDDPSSYINAISEFLPLDESRRNDSRVWIAFYAMVLGGDEHRERRMLRCTAVRKALVEGLSASYSLEVCHHIVDRVFVLVDGIAINALLDPERWTKERQLAVLQEGMAACLDHC